MVAAQRSKQTLKEAQRCVAKGDLTGALTLLDGARQTDPLNPEVLHSIAQVATRLGMNDAAEKCLRQAHAAAPENLQILIEFAQTTALTGNQDEALGLLQSATTQHPDRPELWVALANVLRPQHRLEEAEAFLHEALRLKPNSVAARAGLADIWFDRADLPQAIEAYDAAIKAAPKNAQLRLNRAVAQLHMGNTEQGWRDYEWRLKLPTQQVERRRAGRPLRRWDGRPLNGKGLVICAEQGIGDQIFFASGVDAARQLGGDGQYYADCDPRLVPLYARTFGGVQCHAFEPKAQNGIISADYSWTECEDAPAFFIEIASLPLLTSKAKTQLPVINLQADEDERGAWRNWLNSLGDRPKIGLCWRSGSSGGLRNSQYAALENWAELISRTDADFVSVQYDLVQGELDNLTDLSGKQVHEPPSLDQRNEIDRLAALLSELNAVASAPTTVAALAAAVGTPTIKITSAGSWTGLGEDVEPFRPNAQIVRPKTPGDWSEAFHLAGLALAALPDGAS